MDKNVELIKKYQDELHYKNEAFSKIMELFVEYSNFLKETKPINVEELKYRKYGLEMSIKFQKIMDEMLTKIGH